MSFSQLSAEIIHLSRSPNWTEARREWILADVAESDESETCLCGHYPIRELCTITNSVNGAVATVGNCCVHLFMGLPSHMISVGIKRIRNDPEKAMNKALIDYAYAHHWIDDWQADFCRSTCHKRRLSERQLAMRARINGDVLRRMAVYDRLVHDMRQDASSDGDFVYSGE